MLAAAACGGDVAEEDFALQIELAVGVDESIDAEAAAETTDTVAVIIRDRLNGLGVAVPEVVRVGPRALVVRYREPVEATVEELTALMTEMGHLEFREIDPINPTASAPAGGLDATPDEDVIVVGTTRWIPAMGRDRLHGTGEEVQLTGEFLVAESITQTLDSLDFPAITFSLDEEGADLLEQISTRLAATRAPLGIFFDGELISSPAIVAAMSDRAIITRLTAKEAAILSTQLRSGVLTVPVIVVAVTTGNAGP